MRRCKICPRRSVENPSLSSGYGDLGQAEAPSAFRGARSTSATLQRAASGAVARMGSIAVWRLRSFRAVSPKRHALVF